MLSALRCAPSFLLLYPSWKYSCGAVATVSLHAFLGRPCRNHTNPTVLSKQWVSFPQSFPRKVDQRGIFSMMVLRFVKDLRVGGPCSASLHFTSRPRREGRGLQCQQVEIERATCVKPWLTKICYGSPWPQHRCSSCHCWILSGYYENFARSGGQPEAMLCS